MPSVAANGSTVVVAWVADSAGTVKARVSTNRGSTWGTEVTVGSESVGYASAAVLGSRIAVAWTTPDDVVVRQAISGTWGTAKVIDSLSPGLAPLPYAPAGRAEWNKRHRGRMVGHESRATTTLTSGGPNRQMAAMSSLPADSRDNRHVGTATQRLGVGCLAERRDAVHRLERLAASTA